MPDTEIVAKSKAKEMELVTFPLALYQWSTITFDNKISTPKTRTIQSACDKLVISNDQELYHILTENSVPASLTFLDGLE